MDALLLAAGLGTRLSPLTKFIPKCLTPINGVPLLHIWLSNLSALGVKKIWLNTHHLSHFITKYIEDVDSLFPIQVKLIHEEKLLGTGGTLQHILKECSMVDDIMVIHADNLCETNFNDFYQQHQNRAEQASISLMTFTTCEPEQCGVFVMDKNGRVASFHEKSANPPSRLANAACYIMSRNACQEISEVAKTNLDISIDILPRFMKRIQLWHNSHYHQDIGSFTRFLNAHRLFTKNMQYLQCQFSKLPYAREYYSELSKAISFVLDAGAPLQQAAETLDLTAELGIADTLEQHIPVKSMVFVKQVDAGFNASRHYERTGVLAIPISINGQI